MTISPTDFGTHQLNQAQASSPLGTGQDPRSASGASRPRYQPERKGHCCIPGPATGARTSRLLACMPSMWTECKTLQRLHTGEPGWTISAPTACRLKMCYRQCEIPVAGQASPAGWCVLCKPRIASASTHPIKHSRQQCTTIKSPRPESSVTSAVHQPQDRHVNSTVP
jgi:hypothetical protein